jgi:hypothetical protein
MFVTVLQQALDHWLAHQLLDIVLEISFSRLQGFYQQWYLEF